MAVVSTARILTSSGGTSSDVFSYAMIGAAKSNSDIMKKLNRWNPYSIDIEGQDTYIDGKIYAGDTVRVMVRIIQMLLKVPTLVLLQQMTRVYGLSAIRNGMKKPKRRILLNGACILRMGKILKQMVIMLIL